VEQVGGVGEGLDKLLALAGDLGRSREGRE
jgi:hypothetical protein